MQGYPRSGLSLPQYCQRERICTASFYRWQRIFRQALSTDITAVAAASTTAQDPPAFVDLGTLLGSGAHTRMQLRLDLGGGVILHLSRN